MKRAVTLSVILVGVGIFAMAGPRENVSLAKRKVIVTWVVEQGWPHDLMQQPPAIGFQLLVNSRVNNPSVIVMKPEQYLDGKRVEATTPNVVKVDDDYGVLVMGGSTQVATELNLYKIEWTGTQQQVPYDQNETQLSIRFKITYIGDPPVF